VNQILGTLLGVVAGALLAIISSVLQQRRQWDREDYVRNLTWKREVEKDVRTLRYEAFREYLTACNRINALRIRLNVLKAEGELGDAARKEFRESIADAQVKLQEAQPVYMLVDEGGALHTALKRMTQQAHVLRERLERFEPISWKDNQPFRDARHSCERSMGDLVIGAPAITSPTQNRSLRDRLRRPWTPPEPRS
jgi:hypothetical protein